MICTIASAALLLAALAGPTGAQAAAAHHRQPRAHGARKHHRHGKGHTHVSTTVVGPAGPQGPRGPQGATGNAGPAGPVGPQGPGAVLYTYDSTAPAATEQNTPLGPAGPLHLTASCLQLGPSVVEVLLGSSHPSAVQFDLFLTEENEGALPAGNMVRFTDPPAPLPVGLLGLAATSIGTQESYSHATMTMTDPVHGQLSVFEYVSEGNNECHLSAMWTPAA
jgi:hypothetical protein